MPILFEFDFKKPDYLAIFKWRFNCLNKIRSAPDKYLPAIRSFYRDNPAQFIIDWGITLDPRNVEINLPALIPFILYPRQEEWVDWMLTRWKNREPGICDKSREMGLSWLAAAFAATMCIFYDNLSIGFGSRKVDYVDVIGDPDSIFEKIRIFIRALPYEFRNGWNEKRDSSYLKIRFPNTGSIITGEGGDNIGRGGRQGIYFVDESAWLPRPEAVEASLSMTTNCRIDISTPHGMNNPFARKRHAGKISVFTLRWQDDPRKDIEWYNKKTSEIDDEIVIAQEIDLDYSASMEGVVIPAKWVNAAIDAHIKLGIKPSGERKGTLDIADEGPDLNAFCGQYGFLIEYLEDWSGKGKDIYDTVEKAFMLCDMFGYPLIRYDADGPGAGARGDARIINMQRSRDGVTEIKFLPFRGSGSVVDPEKDPFQENDEQTDKIKARTNDDFFANAKAQAWWHLRKLFRNTYRAVVEGRPYNPDRIISISTSCHSYRKLVNELSQPTYSLNTIGKLIIDKAPDGSRSPNLADAVMMSNAPLSKPKWGFGSDEYI